MWCNCSHSFCFAVSVAFFSPPMWIVTALYSSILLVVCTRSSFGGRRIRACMPPLLCILVFVPVSLISASRPPRTQHRPQFWQLIHRLCCLCLLFLLSLLSRRMHAECFCFIFFSSRRAQLCLSHDLPQPFYLVLHSRERRAKAFTFKAAVLYVCCRRHLCCCSWMSVGGTRRNLTEHGFDRNSYRKGHLKKNFWRQSMDNECLQTKEEANLPMKVYTWRVNAAKRKKYCKSKPSLTAATKTQRLYLKAGIEIIPSQIIMNHSKRIKKCEDRQG